MIESVTIKRNSDPQCEGNWETRIDFSPPNRTVTSTTAYRRTATGSVFAAFRRTAQTHWILRNWK